MSIEVKVPALPESVADATIATWHKKVGDKVSRDENMVDLETDKVVLEVPAPADGVLKEILFKEGATVTSGELLARIEVGAASVDPVSASANDDEKNDDGGKRFATQPNQRFRQGWANYERRRCQLHRV